ncbi:MAG: hypothetical protein HYW33_03310 [Candidatus Blackburnbacteria bacterium]|nr:hypothetical protein [Candidatus Blackburnbacteria bacterium]
MTADLRPPTPESALETFKQLLPTLENIRGLKQQGFIDRISPLWWDVDFTPDPREVLVYDEFKRRLTDLGPAVEIATPLSMFKDHLLHPTTDEAAPHLFLYTHKQVPMAVLLAKIESLWVPLLVTARPYTSQETTEDNPHFLFLSGSPEQAIDQFRDQTSSLNIADEFFPHARGIIAGTRANHVFWYPFTRKGAKRVYRDLAKTAEDYLLVYDSSMIGDHRRAETHDELVQKGFIYKGRPTRIVTEFERVSYEDLFCGQESGNQLQMVNYPLSLPCLAHVPGVAIVSATPNLNNPSRLVVLGIQLETLHKIRDPKFAKEAAIKLSRELNKQVDVAVYLPQPGQSQFYLVSSN